MPISKTILFLVSLLSFINSGYGASVSVSPSEPFVLNVDRRIIDDHKEYFFERPNLSFQLRVDNQGNKESLTIASLILQVDGPVQRKTIQINPRWNLFMLDGSQLLISPRAYFAEVAPYQASFCMDKVKYLKDTNYSRSCSEISVDSTKISKFGVSALNTTESEDKMSCCPSSIGDLSKVIIIASAIQDYSREDLIPLAQTYSINANVAGYFGTYLAPIRNFSTQLVFDAKSY